MNRAVFATQIACYLAAAIALAGCSPDRPGLNTLTAPPGATPDARSAEVVRTDAGQEAYETYCASCHETGANGAPITGNAEDWRDRSALWQAVLFEHANDGYLDMPAKGGRAELSHGTVQAAAEYMLTITHPHIPRD